jgi:hypothetical protein
MNIDSIWFLVLLELGEIRRELGAVIYAANVLGSRGPRKMQVAIPTVDADCNAAVWKPTGNGDDMLSRIKERTFHDLSVLINKPPRWNEQVRPLILEENSLFLVVVLL